MSPRRKVDLRQKQSHRRIKRAKKMNLAMKKSKKKTRKRRKKKKKSPKATILRKVAKKENKLLEKVVQKDLLNLQKPITNLQSIWMIMSSAMMTSGKVSQKKIIVQSVAKDEAEEVIPKVIGRSNTNAAAELSKRSTTNLLRIQTAIGERKRKRSVIY